jgi:hypothetical protein
MTKNASILPTPAVSTIVPGQTSGSAFLTSVEKVIVNYANYSFIYNNRLGENYLFPIFHIYK